MAKQKNKKASAGLDNSLRIIGGKWRGRRFSFPSSAGLRPTSDRIRETLFNWLSPVIVNASCLDLFAGSGAMGLEALSRGAGQVTMIDSSSRVVSSLEQYLSTLNCNDATLINTDAVRWLERPTNNAPYNIVFIDPPFRQGLVAPCCKLLESGNLLCAGSYIYIESERTTTFSVPDTWHTHRSKTSGKVAFSLYVKLA